MRRRSIVIACLTIAACSDGAHEGGAGNATAAPTAERAAPADPNAPGSIDCQRAQGQAQQMICNDQALAALDREAVRLDRLASADSSIDPSVRGAADVARRTWTTARDECWKADELRRCVVGAYGRRIADLRSLSDATRSDTAGSSRGPIAWRCAGASAALVATFVEGAVHFRWSGPTQPGWQALDQAVFAQAASTSDARYQDEVDGNSWTFRIKGAEATLETAAGKTLLCREQRQAGAWRQSEPARPAQSA